MKKQYITPLSCTVKVYCEGMLAGSNTTDMPIGGSGSSTVVDEADVLSNERGWDAASWTDED